MTNSWDARYAGDEYLFGAEPALFLKERADLFRPGATALAVADGEGRNSVWLAEHGVKVDAFDNSRVGVAKAQRLAAAKSVSVATSVADIETYPWDATQYDLVVAVFIQFAPPAMRARIFAGLPKALKPGGLLLLHGYTPKQVEYGTGGPPYRENMYDEPMLRDAFADLEILELTAYEREISEGAGHDGLSALIDFVGRKR